MQQRVLAALCLLFVCTTAVAEPPQGTVREQPKKPAWQWTLDERLAVRFDPRAGEARIAQEKARARAFPESGLPEDELYNVPSSRFSVDGARNPELFLPHELFDHVIHTCFPPDGRDQNLSRRMIERRAAAIGLGSDLWHRLRKSVAPLVEHDLGRYQRFQEATRSGQAMEQGEVGVRRCHLRAAAMESSRKELGEELFLRLLYEAVAPNVSFGYTSEENLQALLRYQEGGCR